MLSSPRPWGCFRQFGNRRASSGLFPTPVGVFPTTSAPDSFLNPLPHARGDVSSLFFVRSVLRVSSPRPWGCFSGRDDHAVSHVLFPTPVEVFLFQPPSRSSSATLPHARGGVSITEDNLPSYADSSPRTWGCFRCGRGTQEALHLFPTPVGVFLAHPVSPQESVPLPHARGGVSVISDTLHALKSSSPRPWGCFRSGGLMDIKIGLFPTHVGVFPSSA